MAKSSKIPFFEVVRGVPLGQEVTTTNCPASVYGSYSYQSALLRFDEYVTMSKSKVCEADEFPVTLTDSGKPMRSYHPGGPDTRLRQPVATHAPNRGPSAVEKAKLKSEAKAAKELEAQQRRAARAKERLDLAIMRTALTKAQVKAQQLDLDVAEARLEARAQARKLARLHKLSPEQILEAEDKPASAITRGSLVAVPPEVERMMARANAKRVQRGE